MAAGAFEVVATGLGPAFVGVGDVFYCVVVLLSFPFVGPDLFLFFVAGLG